MGLSGASTQLSGVAPSRDHELFYTDPQVSNTLETDRAAATGF